jgi:hypothetical protein
LRYQRRKCYPKVIRTHYLDIATPYRLSQVPPCCQINRLLSAFHPSISIEASRFPVQQPFKGVYSRLLFPLISFSECPQSKVYSPLLVGAVGVQAWSATLLETTVDCSLRSEGREDTVMATEVRTPVSWSAKLSACVRTNGVQIRR